MNATSLGIALVVLCTVIEGFAQTFLKKSALAKSRKAMWITFGVTFFIAEALLYTGALQFLDVSTAYPIGSLSFVAVALLSHWLLGEKVTRTRWIGVALILVGASLVVANA